MAIGSVQAVSDVSSFGLCNQIQHGIQQTLNVWFCHERSGSGCKSLMLIYIVGSPRIEKNWRCGVKRSYLAAEFKAVDSGQPCVQHKEVEALRLDLHRRLSGGLHASGVNPVGVH